MFLFFYLKTTPNIFKQASGQPLQSCGKPVAGMPNGGKAIFRNDAGRV
jgi:hypothetical protein